MDYDPLPGPLPSEAAVAAAMSGGYALKSFIVTQSLDQLRSSYENKPADAVNARDLLDRIAKPNAEAGPYGADFTSDGMCRWPDYIREIREATPMQVIGHRFLFVFDEFPQGADHNHRCRKCREHLAGLVQDLEGELGAVMRYPDSEDIGD